MSAHARRQGKHGAGRAFVAGGLSEKNYRDCFGGMENSPMAPRAGAAQTIFAAGIVAGVCDITYVIVYYGVQGSAPLTILQSVARGWYGVAAFKGGWTTGLVGLGTHFFIALVLAAIFYAASRKISWLVRQPWISGPLFGVAVWFAMQLLVLPLSQAKPKSFPPAGWIPVFLAHPLCVGLPIAWMVRRGERAAS